MDKWYLYILKCSDGSLYTGIARDLLKRLSEHEAGKGAKYTKGRAPFELVYKEGLPDRSIATKREIEIKSFSRNEKLELIKLYESEYGE